MEQSEQPRWYQIDEIARINKYVDGAIEKASEESLQTVEYIVERKDTIYGWITRYSGGQFHEDTSDIQDIFVKLIYTTLRQEIKITELIKPALMKAVYRLVQQHIRDEKGRNRRLYGNKHILYVDRDESDNEDEDREQGQISECLVADEVEPFTYEMRDEVFTPMIRVLSEKQIEVFQLCFCEGMSVTQIANFLNKDKGGISKMLDRAINKVSCAIRDGEFDDEYEYDSTGIGKRQLYKDVEAAIVERSTA